MFNHQHRRTAQNLANLACCFTLICAASQGAGAQDTVTKWTPPPSDPRDFEGVWLSMQGGAPPPTAQPAVTGARPAGAPPEIGGLNQTGQGTPNAGLAPPPAAASGTTLQCIPETHIGASGGGLSDLWFQDPHEMVMISESDQDIAKKIYMNARHPANIEPQPNGNSIGHWEGNTLVVDTIGIAKPDGSLRDLRLEERYHKQGHILIDEITMITGNKITHQTARWMWRSDLHLFENVCEEGYQRYQVVNGVVINPNLPPDEAH